MKRTLFVITLVWSLSVLAADKAKTQTAEATVMVDGPLIVGFFPPVTEKEMNDPDSGASEGIAHVSFALQDTMKCLKNSNTAARAQLEIATVLVVSDGKTKRKIELPTAWPYSSGVYLFLPGKLPRRISAQAGPSSLVVLVPKAAADFFGAAACRDE